MMITAKGLQKKFGSFQALKGIDLNVQEGEVYGFLGHNGAGKSTTMNILTGLSKATSGTCLVNGWDVNKVVHPGDLHIGYLPEEPHFYKWMTGREVLSYLGDRWADGNVAKRVDEMLDWVGLKKASNRRVGGYSRGMKQRLGMAVALFYDSPLILLDEPSSALDPEGRSDVLNLILDLKSRGKTVFLSTHILSDAERVCDRVGILSHGKMMVEKPLNDLLADNVESVYNIVLDRKFDDSFISGLEQLPSIKHVENKGERISIAVESIEVASKALLSFFSNNDVSVHSFALRKPSLEDIFLEEVSKIEN